MRVTSRDRQLLAVLAQARCLSSSQVMRLFWPAQVEQGMRRRMRLLSGGGRPLVKPVDWYMREGRKRAWVLTPAGYIEAESELEGEAVVATDDVGVEYLEHHVLLTDLLVGLLAAPVAARAASAEALKGVQRARVLAAAHATAHHPRFRWTVGGDSELPWREPAGAGGAFQARVIRPDAVLEFPQAGRRIFVESEVGTHTIDSASPAKYGSTLGKASRYEAYVSGLASLQPRRTWYQARYPDGARPEVLFLVRREGRAASVEEALAGWRQKHPHAACTFRVATVEAAVAECLPLAAPGAAGAPRPEGPAAGGGRGAAVAGAAGVALTAVEVAAVRRFFGAVHADFKARRDMARVQRAPLPEYPQGTQELHELLKRIP